MCSFYNSRTGCSRGNKCRFAHIGELHPRMQSNPPVVKVRHTRNIACKNFENGYCHRGNECQYFHKKRKPNNETQDISECSICYEIIANYGILGSFYLCISKQIVNCEHPFCLKCIR
jgi:hypothetical protein